MRKTTLLILLTVLLLLMVVSASQAKPFYDGEVIKIIVTTKPGGGYDFYGRLMAQFMKKYLPGSTIITKNVPGAGHMLGTNTIYMAKPDGLTIGTFNRAVGLLQAIEQKGVRYDFTKFSWLGSPSSELYSYCVNASKYKNLDDVLNAKKTKIATSGLGGMNHVTALLFNYMKGSTNYSIGTGYEGGETSLAIMRGEMDGAFGSFNSRKGMVDEGYGRFVLFIGPKNLLPAGYEDVPFIQDLIKEKQNKPVVDFLIGMQVIGRPFAGPPGIPADRLKILRKAFKQACDDPKMISFAKRAERPVGYVSDVDTQAWAKGIFGLPANVIKMLKDAHRGD